MISFVANFRQIMCKCFNHKIKTLLRRTEVLLCWKEILCCIVSPKHAMLFMIFLKSVFEKFWHWSLPDISLLQKSSLGQFFFMYIVRLQIQICVCAKLFPAGLICCKILLFINLKETNNPIYMRDLFMKCTLKICLQW